MHFQESVNIPFGRLYPFVTVICFLYEVSVRLYSQLAVLLPLKGLNIIWDCRSEDYPTFVYCSPESVLSLWKRGFGNAFVKMSAA